MEGYLDGGSEVAMLDPQDIIDQIEDDLMIGCVTVPVFIDVAVMPDNYGPYEKHRFVSDMDGLVTFLFDLSLSKKILTFERVRNPSEISVNGYVNAVVGYKFHVMKCGKNENGSNLTPELIGKLASLFDIDELIKRWFSDEEVQEWKKLAQTLTQTRT